MFLHQSSLLRCIVVFTSFRTDLITDNLRLVVLSCLFSVNVFHVVVCSVLVFHFFIKFFYDLRRNIIFFALSIAVKIFFHSRDIE